MSEDSARVFLEHLKETLSWCSSESLQLSDDEIICYIFEEFCTDAASFLHPYTLNRLLESGLITYEIAYKSSVARVMWFELERAWPVNDNSWTIQDVRADAKWQALFKLADEILELIEQQEKKA